MNRQQVVRRQVLATVIVLGALLILLSIHEYMLTFAHQVPLGKLTEATLATASGTLPPCKDPAILAAIQSALPRYKPGPGMVIYEHSHMNYALVLIDDRGTQVALNLPSSESEMVSIGPRPSAPSGNEWPMPRLLPVLARYGLPAMEANKVVDPGLKSQLEFWRDNFGAPAQHSGQGD